MLAAIPPDIDSMTTLSVAFSIKLRPSAPGPSNVTATVPAVDCGGRGGGCSDGLELLDLDPLGVGAAGVKTRVSGLPAALINATTWP